MTSSAQEDKSSFVEHFLPGYFALVMATGIVSLAMHSESFPVLPQALLWLNVIFYIVLWVINILRFALFRSTWIADLTHHAKGVTFLTVVAATAVLGAQFANLTPFMGVAVGLWLFAVLLWILLIYTFFAAVTITEPKPSIDVAINGSWLLVTVATESLCVLGTLVARALGPVTPILFGALCTYLLGVIYYIHRVDCLSLDFSSHRAGQTYGPVLDQYGCFGDYNIGRGAVDSQFEKLGSSTRFPTVYRRLYAVLLGNGNLVDPTVGHCRLLEACCRACPNYI